jgi:hypothetical protein
MIRFATSLLVVAVLTLPAVATAQGATHHRAHKASHHHRHVILLSAMESAEAAARAYWRAPLPCPTGVHVTYPATLPTPNEVNAGPDQAALRAGTMEVQAWAAYGDPLCTVHLPAVDWDQQVLEERGSGIDANYYHLFCDVWVHEIGHFLGHLDEGQTNPASIQYPTIEEGAPNYNSVPECLQGGDDE